MVKIMENPIEMDDLGVPLFPTGRVGFLLVEAMYLNDPIEAPN